MIIPNGVSKLTIETVAPHEFWKFFGIIISDPSFLYGSDIFWHKGADEIVSSSDIG